MRLTCGRMRRLVGLLFALLTAFVLAGGGARDAASRSTGCDESRATMDQTRDVASRSATVTARIHNQGCAVSFVFILFGPKDPITTREYHPAAQEEGEIAMTVSGLDPGTTYLVKGRLWDRYGDWPVYTPTQGEVYFRTLARLEIFKRGQGAVTSTPAGIDCGAVCGVDLQVGGGLSLTATPAPGWRFGHWEGDACSDSAPTCAAWVTTVAFTTAVFDQASLVTITRSGTGSGSVASTPAALDCGSTCAATFDPGGNITLAAAPNAGSRFAHWSGACTGSGSTCSFAPGIGSASVDATFVKLATLTIHRSGHGVIRDEAGKIDCGTTCTATLDDGSSTSLHAKPQRGYVFAGWKGGCSNKSLTCIIQINGAATVEAAFKAKPAPKARKRVPPKKH